MDQFLMLISTWFCVRSHSIIRYVDFDVIREQIKGEFKKKIKITRKHNETRFEFEKTTNGLNIVFTKDTQIQHN